MEDKKPKSPVSIPTPGTGPVPSIRGERALAGGFIQSSETEPVIAPEVREYIQASVEVPEISADLQKAGVTNSQPAPHEIKGTLDLQVSPKEAKAVDITHGLRWLLDLMIRAKNKIIIPASS